MAAGVAHEFRNPLTSIKGFAQLLQQGNEKPEYIELILSEVGRLEAMGIFNNCQTPSSENAGS
ncbi:histidine kinase dimerization/phospho-acceptor domain-containing protein [Paenibacillus lautus]|uniref:histidine kinase dimerization/phospho-acceptor domain-containing protein n=1 Tax=Paenibacillus lautus TaxID=1401 RepID=UPI00384FBF30